MQFEMNAKVRDKLAGYEGRIIGITQWATGRVQLAVRSEKTSSTGGFISPVWFEEVEIEGIEVSQVSEPKKSTKKAAKAPEPEFGMDKEESEDETKYDDDSSIEADAFEESEEPTSKAAKKAAPSEDDMVRAAMDHAKATGGIDKTKAVLGKFGFKSPKHVPEEKRAEMISFLSKTAKKK